ncbi:helix-turn-helix transcriptional regulator [Flavobacterium sp. LPB0248]|uniref:helix-turn-helix domain-containing protein n=1 Tax=Flavobacterium sp. LPB0248 TaxID=2614441 RepID=UPI0015A5559C|nr:helix-turn-helix transcriptional regulator [Flavobacterium sp. LPB0248]QLC64814.1 helix-turn-helix transcriptional regulator [Flavobacterium sp. LPB0248]
MSSVERFDTVKQYNDSVGADTLHPLVTVVDFKNIPPFSYFRRYMGVYAVFLKEVKCGDIRYGCQPYDYDDGTLVFIAPGQVYGIDTKGEKITPKGKALVFHPDLITGTNLGKTIKEYSFFSYEVNEALHLSKKESAVINDCFDKIATEIELNIDKHSKSLIVSNIELFLRYGMRFYDRQFITRTHVNNDILTRFENQLSEYFLSDKPALIGLPSVGYFADQLNLSANYFGDLIKKETGSTALDYIQSKLIELAKEKILEQNKTITEVSDELGFKYQQHFTRLFKQKVGMAPVEFKSLNKMN